MSNTAWMSAGEASAFLGISPKTLNRYNICKRRTPGGHRRYLFSDIKALANGVPPETVRSWPLPPALRSR